MYDFIILKALRTKKILKIKTTWNTTVNLQQRVLFLFAISSLK